MVIYECSQCGVITFLLIVAVEQLWSLGCGRHGGVDYGHNMTNGHTDQWSHGFSSPCTQGRVSASYRRERGGSAPSLGGRASFLEGIILKQSNFSAPQCNYQLWVVLDLKLIEPS